MPSYTWNLTLAKAQVYIYFNSKKRLEKLCMFLFRCEGKFLLTLCQPHYSAHQGYVMSGSMDE